jgi:hypothetical protein
MRRTGTLLLLLGLAATGCGDDGGSADRADLDDGASSSVDETTTAAADTSDTEVVCEHLGTVEQLDRESGRASESAVAQMQAGADPAIVVAALHDTAAMLEAAQPQMATAYAAAAAAAQPEVAADIEALAASSAALSPLMVAAFDSLDSVDDLATLDQAFSTPELLAAAQQGAAAAVSLNRFTEAVCGFTLTD